MNVHEILGLAMSRHISIASPRSGQSLVASVTELDVEIALSSWLILHDFHSLYEPSK